MPALRPIDDQLGCRAKGRRPGPPLTRRAAWAARRSTMANPMAVGLVGSERVRRHPHHRP